MSAVNYSFLIDPPEGQRWDAMEITKRLRKVIAPDVGVTIYHNMKPVVVVVHTEQDIDREQVEAEIRATSTAI